MTNPHTAYSLFNDQLMHITHKGEDTFLIWQGLISLAVFVQFLGDKKHTDGKVQTTSVTAKIVVSLYDIQLDSTKMAIYVSFICHMFSGVLTRKNIQLN